MSIISELYPKLNVYSQEDLETKLKEHNIPLYVNYNESFQEIEKLFPVFKTFHENSTYSSIKINSFYGENLVDYQTLLSSLLINVIIFYFIKKDLI